VEDRLRIARVRFRGNAQRWAQPRIFDDWPDFERQFLDRFGETPEAATVRLERCYQKTGESPKNFADRFLEQAERAGRASDTALLHQFIRRLLSELRLEVTRQRPTSIEEAIEFCSYWTGTNTENTAEAYNQNNSFNTSQNRKLEQQLRNTSSPRPYRNPWRPQDREASRLDAS
jgi:hypothetical protein